jgi:hypothetical protein
MGIAQFNNGVFRLVVSCRHDADSVRLNEWRAAFQHASQMLFDATLGQHRFGEILVANRSMGGAEADLWLMENDGLSGSSHRFAQLGEHSTLMADERFRPFVILHEFSHYAYDVFDEYQDHDTNPAECIGGSTANACIMESGWTQGDRFGNNGDGGLLTVGRVKHFCIASNHDPDNDTRQEASRHHSCWESMVRRFPSLVIPTQPPTNVSPGIVPNIRWTILIPEQRYILIADRSGSMSGSKLREAKSGCHWWADSAAEGDLLGIVSFSSSASVDYQLQVLTAEADRVGYHTAIDAWRAGGETAIGGALRTGLDEIVGLGEQAATQVAILLTDGLQTEGEAVSSVSPDLQRAGVRVYAIGVGSTIDEPLLNTVATETGGRFVRIDPSLSEADQSFAIRTALEEMSFEARDNGGVVTSSERTVKPGSVLRTRVRIEEGSTKTTFLISHRHPKDDLSLHLTDPSGATLTLDSVASNIRVIQSQDHLALQVNSPRNGSWQVEIRLSEKSLDNASFRMIVGSENSNLGIAFHTSAPVYKPGDPVRLYLRVFAPLPITGIKIKAVLHSKGKAKSRILLSDDGSVSGDDVARDGVYTGGMKAPITPGTYLVRAEVYGGTKTVRVAELDDFQDRQPAELDDFQNRQRSRRRVVIPTFKRTLETAFVVVKE